MWARSDVADFTLSDSLRPDMKDVLFRAGELGTRFEMVIGVLVCEHERKRCRWEDADPHYVGHLCE